MRTVSAVVLAAGLSTRFGGANKVLAPWRGRSMVAHVVQTLAGCGLDVTVVTGRDAELVEHEVSPATTVYNPRFAEGMGTSIAVGVASLTPCDGILIALADMPDIRTEVVTALVEAFQSATEAAIVVPVYEVEPDHLGHPVLFSAIYRRDLECLTLDQGAKSVLNTHAEQIIHVPVTGSLHDFDSLTDLTQ